MARVVSISNHKGGVGKTTITANLGFSTARFFKVLLVDLDPQANLSTGLGYANEQLNIGHYFTQVIHFRKPTVVPYAINDYVHVIPSTVNLIDIEKRLHETVRSEYILKEILDTVKSQYDIIILDCPPSFNLLTINALTCSNLIVVPAKPEVFSIDGLALIKSFAEKNDIPFKILFNQVNERSVLHKKIMHETITTFSKNVVQQIVRNNIALAEAFAHARNIFTYRSKSLGAKDFTSVTDELIPYF
jgi:chromosome partitioning protein